MARTHNRWTSEEIEILRQYYPLEGSEVSKRVNHSPASCRTRAGLLGLHFYQTKGGSKNWTPEEDNIIRTYYPEQGKAVASMLNNRTRHDIFARAITLGVQHKKYAKQKDKGD